MTAPPANLGKPSHMTTQTSSATAGRRLAEAPGVAAAIDRLVAELETVQAGLTGARPPRGELVESYEDALDRYGELRGRGLLFPYLGSGVGRGPLVELADGSVKWDLINGIGVHMFGHGEPDLVATAVRAALGDTVMQGNLQCNEDAVAFAELLVAEASRSSELRHCFLTNSGAMANESALKIAMQKRDGRAPRVIAFADCFMGRSTTMAQIGDSAAGRSGLPLSALVDYMPFFDPASPERSAEMALKHLHAIVERYPGQHACFVMELVQGEGGFNVAPPSFLEALMRFCRDRDIAVWVDEIQTFGRTESMYHFEQLGLGSYVDIVTIGKMSQVCACLYTANYNPRAGLLSGTFIGSTVGLQVGRRILERLRDGGYYGPEGRIAQLHEAFRTRAAALVERRPEWFPPVRSDRHLNPTAVGHHGGVGGMMRLTPFGGDKAAVQRLLHVLFESGVIAFHCGHDPYHLRFLPPVGVMEPAHFDPVFEILEAALARTADEIGDGAA